MTLDKWNTVADDTIKEYYHDRKRQVFTQEIIKHKTLVALYANEIMEDAQALHTDMLSDMGDILSNLTVFPAKRTRLHYKRKSMSS